MDQESTELTILEKKTLACKWDGKKAVVSLVNTKWDIAVSAKIKKDFTFIQYYLKRAFHVRSKNLRTC